MFGTDYPVLEYAEALGQVEELGFGVEVENRLLSGNAKDVFVT